MNAIKITEQNGKQAVSARELHCFLESKRQFADWIKERIEKYGLIENVDFQVFHDFVKNPNGGRPLTEYALTVDAAKELSMVEGNEKGKQARKYFIDAENKFRSLRQSGGFQIPSSFKEALLLAAQQQEQIEEKQRLLAAQAPKVAFADAITASNTSCLIGELAKILAQNGIKIGQNRMFEWLRLNGYLGKHGERYNVPNQQYIEQGLFELKKGVRSGNDGVMHTTLTTKVTGKGQQYFINKLMSATNHFHSEKSCISTQ